MTDYYQIDEVASIEPDNNEQFRPEVNYQAGAWKEEYAFLKEVVKTAKVNRHQSKYSLLESKLIISAGRDRVPGFVKELADDRYLLTLAREAKQYYRSDSGVPPINAGWMLAKDSPPLRSVSIEFTEAGAKASGIPVDETNKIDLVLSDDPRVARFTVDIFKMVAYAFNG